MGGPVYRPGLRYVFFLQTAANVFVELKGTDPDGATFK